MKSRIVFLAFVLLIHSVSYSQDNTVKAVRVNETITFDGELTESIWQKTPRTSGFIQRELNYGEPITEQTEVAVLYDKNTLYIGVWCYQKEVSRIVAKNMNHDFNFRSDDNFQIMISPYDDNRTGYLFVVNPNGAKADLQIYGGEDANRDWNGVWDAKTTQTDEGWFTEIYIPFSTLQFKNDVTLNWAINFERDIVSENEQALWQGWSRDNSIFSVNKAGKLTGVKNIAYAKKFELKPYVLFGVSNQTGEKTNYPFKVGANMNISITPTLKLNLTSYTDFAQVESDRIPVNLSRFSKFYPEKRQFFLEGKDLFSFYLGNRNTVFYSRELGVEQGKQVPIIAGARLYGKLNNHNIGFLNMQEGEVDSIPSSNNMVLRYKYDLGKQSFIGGILTNKANELGSNQVIGIDAGYKTAHFLKNKNLVIGTKLAASMDDLEWNKNALSYGVFLDYPNDLIDNFMAVSSLLGDFNPELGFMRRKNYDSYSWYTRFSPRLFTEYGIKRLTLKPWGFTRVNTHDTGEFEAFRNETRPLGAVLKTGDRFEFNLIQEFDRIDTLTDISDAISIDVGKYWMYQYEIQLESYHGRKLWGGFVYNWGDFYTGDKKTYNFELGLNIDKHTNINAAYTYNKVNVDTVELETNEIALYFNYAFTTKLNLSLFSQYNDLDQVNLANFRLHWIPKVGSDLYVVYKLGYNEGITQIDLLKPTSTDAVAKLVYRFVF